MVKYLIETMGVPGHGLFEIEKAEGLKGFYTPFTGLVHRGQSYADIHRLMPEGVSLLGEAIKKSNRSILHFLVEETGGGKEQLPSRYTGLEHLASPHYTAIFFDDTHVFDYLLGKVNLDMKALEECLLHVLSQATAREECSFSLYIFIEALTARLGPDVCRSVKGSLDSNALESSRPSIKKKSTNAWKMSSS